MPVVYRGMNEEPGTGLPTLTVPPGAKSLALLARIRPYGTPGKVRADIAAEPDGTVRPGGGGMSVNSTWEDSPHFFVPARLHGVPPFRNGTAGDDCRIWSHPVDRVPGVADTQPFADRLVLRMGAANHGGVEPATAMYHADFNAAIAGTRSAWRVDEPPVRAHDGGKTDVDGD